MSDTSTELFAAVAGWEYPMSMVDMLLVTSAYGKSTYKVLPFDPAGQVSPAEVEQAHDELLNEIRFS